MRNRAVKYLYAIFFTTSIIFLSCSRKTAPIIVSPQKDSATTVIKTDTITTDKQDTVKKIELSPFEKKLVALGLVEVTKLDSSIKVELKYSTPDNFMHRDMYGDFDKAYLQKEVADKLVKAQHYLKDTVPWYSLIIYDAVRPRIVQQWMWDSVNVPDRVRYKYLSNPKYGSLHNFGAAVDVSIINDSTGEPLDMGTPYDCFCELAYPYFEKKFLKLGKLTIQQYKNRLLLRKVMRKAGFTGISTEWWHFNSCSRKTARKKYPIIEDFSGLKPQIAENKPKETIKTNTQSGHKVVFRVQIKISKKPLPPTCACFKGLNVWRYYHKGYYKYTSGEFTDLGKALQYRNKLRKMGFKDCFVAAFDGEKRISFKDAYKLMEE